MPLAKVMVSLKSYGCEHSIQYMNIYRESEPDLKVTGLTSAAATLAIISCGNGCETLKLKALNVMKRMAEQSDESSG